MGPSCSSLAASAALSPWPFVPPLKQATQDELRASFRRLALQLHPDRAGAASTRRFQAVQEAFKVLADPDQRACYDKTLVAQLDMQVCGAVGAVDGWTSGLAGAGAWQSRCRCKHRAAPRSALPFHRLTI